MSLDQTWSLRLITNKYKKNTVTIGSVTTDGIFDWRLDLLTTLTHGATTFNYSAITDIHTLQITTSHATSFQSAVSSPVVPW
jgi:hypothetical protein